MIKEYEYLHGVVFCRLCSVPDIAISIEPFKDESHSSYVLDDRAGLYIKYSGKRLSPWRFTLRKSHQDEIDALQAQYHEVFIALVCNLDGIAMLNYAELKEILDGEHKESEWISVARTKGKMYSVAGSDGRLKFKVGMRSCPDKIIQYKSASTRRATFEM